ncbi:MAG: cation:proton antiporter [Proteobacteria bacterium]|nr:cation:proton antiporter [Pseudomonadota bacterium]
MPDAVELTGIALVAVGALICGIITTRLRQPAVIGYIFAGVLLGPSGLAFVENRDQIAVLAELGVLLLLFLIGMELSLRGFARVWRVAISTTALQITISVGFVLLLAQIFDWSLALTLLIAFAVSLSSTAVAIKILEDIAELRTDAGRTAVGILIAQGLAVVPMLLIIDGLAEDGAIDLFTVGKIVVAIVFLAFLIKFLSGRRRIHLPFSRAIGKNRDLTPLTALAYCFAAAAASGVIGLSPVDYTFLAGLLIGNSTERAAVHTATQPIQSILLMVFFLSIGLLIDLGYIWANLGTVLSLLFVVAILKSAMNVGVLHLLGEPWQRSFLAGVVLAQIGEFSFVILAAGSSAGIVDDDGYRLFVAVIALNLVLSPLWLNAARRLHNLASRSVPTLGELLDDLYGHEVTMISEGSVRLTAAARRAEASVRDWLIGASKRIYDSTRNKSPRATSTPPAADAATPKLLAAPNRPAPRRTSPKDRKRREKKKSDGDPKTKIGERDQVLAAKKKPLTVKNAATKAPTPKRAPRKGKL